MTVNSDTAAKRTIITKGAIFLVWLTIAALAGSASAGTYSGGTGTEGDPYLISTAEDMQSIGANPTDWDKHFLLTNDIDLSAYTGTQFNIIGYYISSSNNNPFSGVFDGNGHTISNFTYSTMGGDDIGLFAWVRGASALVKDLTLADPNVKTEWCYDIGCLVGLLDNGTIAGCGIEGGSVSGYDYTGGLVGFNSGTISNSYAAGNVTGDDYTGGLVGGNGGTISNCYATGSVSGADGTGGLVGGNGGAISNCYAAGSVTGDGLCTGGLVASNGGTISNCYAECSVTGGWWCTGGLVGSNDGTISDCYATGSVSGTDWTGGLVGGNGGTISNCYAAGIVDGNDFVGGLIGYDYGDTGGYTKSFWDKDVNPSLTGIGNRTNPEVIGESTANMRKQSTFTDAGWDFVGETVNGERDIWKISEGEDYPELTPQPAFYGGGYGSAEYPYEIRTKEQMNEIGTKPNDWDKYFILMADVNLASYNGTEFNIIGCVTCPIYPADGKAFSGVFDGNDHTISNFTYSTTDTDHIGLFGYVDDPNAVIKNLTLVTPDVNAAGESDYVSSLVGRLESGTITGCGIEGGRVRGEVRIGGLVGINKYGTVSNCWGTGSVSGDYCIGGLVGRNYAGAISDCNAEGSVSGEYGTGGLVGDNYEGTISNCYAAGDVTGNSDTGGLVGGNGGTISNCHTAGSVSGEDFGTGGLVGENYGTISNCYAAGSVTGNNYTGGLVGHNNRTISNCYAAGGVTGSRSKTGGLAGGNYGTISNCYAAGRVTGTEKTGGLVGWNRHGTISNCYAVGIVDGNDFVGGLIGYDYEDTGGYTKSFWDKDVNPDVNGIGNADDPNVIGESTVNMQTESTFTDAGWDFDMPVWKICEAVDYPRLEWEMIDWPIIDEEPEVTTGTSNTITWQEVNGAIEYYAICCSDANLENIAAESGWVDVNEWTFDGLETGQTYWYAVKARQNCVLESDWSDVVSSLQGTLGDAVDVMLDADSLKNSNMKNALMNKIEEVLEMIDAGLYEDALKKLENDILKKTDGCFKTGQPDKNDWIKTCEQQQLIYPFVMETIDYVNSLIQ